MNFFVEAKEPELLSRCGYKPGESLKAYEAALLESGAVATGKALHFSADLLCSGAYDIWVAGLWDFAIDHVGIASPRLFVYLKKRIGELDALFKKYPDETLYNNDEFHTRIGEIIMVLREVPRRPKVTWPKVGPETHLDGWLRASVSDGNTETAVLRRVWKGEGDLMVLKLAGGELLRAVTSASLEKTLFWVKWLFEEEANLKKETKGATLSTVQRGPGGSTDVGHYIATLFAETYKDLASRQLIRMNEEAQTLIELWRGGDSRVTPSSRKKILGIFAQMLCEVPRWKVPAAPALINDPVQVSRAVAQTGKFFREVLAHPAVQGNKALTKAFKNRGALPSVPKKKKVGEEALKEKMDAYDEMIMNFMNK